MALLEGVDIVEPNVLYSYLPPIFLEAGHLLIRAALVMKHQVPRQILVLWAVRV